MPRFLAALTPAASIAARHTVGLVDTIAGHPREVDDGLPESLEEVVAAYGHTFFKLKVGGVADADLQRLIGDRGGAGRHRRALPRLARRQRAV